MTSGPSALRSAATWTWSALRAVAGALPPQRLVDELIGRDDGSGLEQQQSQQGAWPSATEREGAPPVAGFQRPEDAELHR